MGLHSEVCNLFSHSSKLVDSSKLKALVQLTDCNS